MRATRVTYGAIGLALLVLAGIGWQARGVLLEQYDLYRLDDDHLAVRRTAVRRLGEFRSLRAAKRLGHWPQRRAWLWTGSWGP